MWEIAAKTFAWGAPGAVLFQLMFVALISWFLSCVASAVGNGQIANGIKVVSIFVCIYLITSIAWKAVTAIGKLAGIV